MGRMDEATSTHATRGERNTTVTSKAFEASKRIIWQAGALMLGIGLGGALFFGSSKRLDAASAGDMAKFHASYTYVSRDEMIAGADAIVIGRVADISQARWNQDRGEIWQEPGLTTLPYHELDIEVLEVLSSRDTMALGDSLTLTVLGASPAGSIRSAGVEIAGHAEHDLEVGDEAVFFVVSRELAWRGGSATRQATRPIVRFMGEPLRGYLTRGKDGLYHPRVAGEQPLSLESLESQIASVEQQP
jgi:hypothetical protein